MIINLKFSLQFQPGHPGESGMPGQPGNLMEGKEEILPKIFLIIYEFLGPVIQGPPGPPGQRFVWNIFQIINKKYLIFSGMPGPDGQPGMPGHDGQPGKRIFVKN